uniref:Uncharacterized protein n=1 Tax=Phocoena sinus TaxID=42100 RepID=A0A8C9B4D3_PHOSS
MDNSKAAQVVLTGPFSLHLTMDPNKHDVKPFLQCSTYLSHSHSPVPCTATFSPPRQGSPSLVVHAGVPWGTRSACPLPSTHLLHLPLEAEVSRVRLTVIRYAYW